MNNDHNRTHTPQGNPASNGSFGVLSQEMNDITETLTELRGTLMLTAEERTRMRADLARLAADVRPTALPSPYFSYFMRPSPAFAMALALVLIVGGTASASANGALPGDALYSLKVHVNENFERALALSPEAKAYIDVKHAEERLSEVELLAAKGSVDEHVATKAAAEVTDAIGAASVAAGSLDERGDVSGADGLRAHIASALLAHADILDAQAEELPDGAQQTLRALSVAAAVTADDASSDDGNPSLALAAPVRNERTAGELDGRADAVRDRIDALTKAIADADGIPEETHDELMAELASIETGYREAEASRGSGDLDAAAEDYTVLERRAYRALSALALAERIGEKTGKEVLLTIDSGDEDGSSEAAPVLMKAAAFAASASATTTERAHRHERPLQFLVRDRSDSRGKGSSEDRDRGE